MRRKACPLQIQQQGLTAEKPFQQLLGLSGLVFYAYTVKLVQNGFLIISLQKLLYLPEQHFKTKIKFNFISGQNAWFSFSPYNGLIQH